MTFACFNYKVTAIQWMVILVTLEAVKNIECANSTTSNTGPARMPNSNEFVLTAREKAAFEKFKSRVFDKVPRDLELLRQDLYFLRFLRAHNLDVDVAARDFLKMVNFFEENNMKTILTEDWTDMEEGYPVYFAEDRQKRPVYYATLQGVWNLRQGLIRGHNRMIRYTYKLVMETYGKLEAAGRKYSNVTQISVLMDLDGFNLFQQGCAPCLSVLFQFFSLYERWMPGYTRDITFVNAPSSIYVLFQTLRPALSQRTNSILKIFTTNKSQWKPFLDERIDPKQLPDYLGGTKKAGL